MKGTTKRNISKEGGLLSNFLAPLMKVGLPFIKHWLKSLAKIALIATGLIVAASEKDIQKEGYGLGMTTLIISNKKNER